MLLMVCGDGGWRRGQGVEVRGGRWQASNVGGGVFEN